VIRFLHTHTLGLRQAEGSVAWESVVIQPVPGPSLTWASGSHETPQGSIRVEWRIEDDDFHISAELPAATSARIVFPDGTVTEAGPGLYRGHRSVRHPSLAPALTN
jgi:alpha-L-rhamnosidase